MDFTFKEKLFIGLKTLKSGSFQNCSKNFTQVSLPCFKVFQLVLSAFAECMVKLALYFIFTAKENADIPEAK